MGEKVFKILVVHHKKDKVYSDDVYMPIHAGKSLSNIELDMIGDNTGYNISKKNPYYCELTALYWAWKNLKNIDFIGLCHYRRYFDFYDRVPSIYYVKYESIDKMDSFDFILPENIKTKLINGEIVVPVNKTMNKTVFKDYCKNHVIDDLRMLRRILVEKSSDSYVRAFDKVMIGNKYSPYNMFIMSWNDFDRYCSWLFDLLFELEKSINLDSRSKYQQRIFGFMAERLLNVFLIANNKKLDKYPVIMFREDSNYKSYSYLKRFSSLIFKGIQFVINKDPKRYKEFIKG